MVENWGENGLDILDILAMVLTYLAESEGDWPRE